MTRHDAREQAYLIVFEAEFAPDSPPEELIEAAEEARDIKIDDYARKAATACINNLGDIDAVISRYSDKWKIDRLPHTTLAALRLAVCEIKYLGEPHGAIINEAVELAKRYGADEDASFVNGVLGGYAKSLTDA